MSPCKKRGESWSEDDLKAVRKGKKRRKKTEKERGRENEHGRKRKKWGKT